MKKIRVAYIKNNNNLQVATNFIKLILTRTNSFLKINGEINDEKVKNVINNNESVNCIFYSHFLPPQNAEIVFKKFDIESFYKQIDFFIEDVYDDLDLLSSEPYDKENNAEIKSILRNNCLVFEMNPPKDLISFFVKIFFDILTGHRLKNGNKRVATLLLHKLCYHYGFFLISSLAKNSYDGWKNNETKIIEFIEEYQKTHSTEKIQTKIYKWLMDNLYIANNFEEQ
ncbi:hypothetical protein II941_01765 [bacterium]|nr:hypothetical protein [bacterium]